MALKPWKNLLSKIFPFSINNKAALTWAGAFVICFTIVLFNVGSNKNYKGLLDEFEVGKVADRDVVTDHAISYEDELATRLRVEAQERLVPAVFQYSYKVTDGQLSLWNNFVALAENLPMEVNSTQAYALSLLSEFQSEFQLDFPDDVLELLYKSEERQELLRDCGIILGTVLEGGIFSMPQSGLTLFNPDAVELIRQAGVRIEQEMVPFWSIVTKSEAAGAVDICVAAGSYPPIIATLAPKLLDPFLEENVFYSPEETAKRILEAKAATEPVMRYIEKGARVIRKGFVVTEEDMEELRALRTSLQGNDLPVIFANLFFLLLLFGLLVFFSSHRIAGRKLRDRENYLISSLSALYIAGSVLVRNIPVESMPASVVIPTALVVMLPAILVHPRLALMLGMALPLGAFFTGSFDAASFIFAIISGVVAAYSIHGAEKRMDLVRAGLIIAAANLAGMITVLLWQHSAAGVYPRSLFWAAFNGVASGMLVLGVLPPLEHALNAATTFRLIELSDLNTPILRRLFTMAPGSYSHSIMVANLAETACQDIMANSILARVGAYYHDLGKMENPGYFVENQDEYNPHDEMAPRLSATVLRSHVKLGVEKARQLGLPREVIDIIGEHHGNSVITWFYSKALKQENSKKVPINTEDFCYQGNPPRSRESAVVMLADVTEAAVRTLNKPTAVRIEKFIQELISKKVEQGQLSQSELTFRDLEAIKNAFVRVLAAYYHSRIEYPTITPDTGNETHVSGKAAEK